MTGFIGRLKSWFSSPPPAREAAPVVFKDGQAIVCPNGHILGYAKRTLGEGDAADVDDFRWTGSKPPAEADYEQWCDACGIRWPVDQIMLANNPQAP